MKKSAVVFLFFLMTLSNTQLLLSQEKINQFNEDGQRIGVWKKYYPNKRIRYEGQFINGKEVGIFKYYSSLSSEHPTAIKTFLKGSTKAEVQFFTDKGVLKSTGQMKGKQRIGKWLYFNIDGKTLLAEENYKEGVLNGVAKTFYFNGKLTEVSFYKNGKLHGNLKRYSDNGVLLDDLNYNKGKLHGPAKYYSVDGTLLLWGDYENDQKIGVWNASNNKKELDSKQYNNP
jgi:antitoxin component YwqK of YwqJK toxin-antitoxin module